MESVDDEMSISTSDEISASRSIGSSGMHARSRSRDSSDGSDACFGRPSSSRPASRPSSSGRGPSPLARLSLDQANLLDGTLTPTPTPTLTLTLTLILTPTLTLTLTRAGQPLLCGLRRRGRATRLGRVTLRLTRMHWLLWHTPLARHAHLQGERCIGLQPECTGLQPEMHRVAAWVHRGCGLGA